MDFDRNAAFPPPQDPADGAPRQDPAAGQPVQGPPQQYPAGHQPYGPPPQNPTGHPAYGPPRQYPAHGNAQQHPAGYPPYGGPQQYPAGHQPYPGPMMPQAVPPARVGTTFGRCVLASLVWVGVVLVLLLALAGAPGSARAAGFVVGSMVLPLLCTAWITWLFFRRKAPVFGLLVLASLPTFVITFFVFGAARLAGRA